MKNRILKGFMPAVLLMVTLAMHATVVTYSPDNTTIFKNPERGFTEELSRKVTEDKPNVVKGNIDSNWGNKDSRRLVMVLYNFKYFKEQDLPEKVLQGFDEDMQELRNYGLKCVLRFAYTESESDKKDATPDWVERHLAQLKPHLEANADVIYVLEAGFVGVWGEWYYTENYGNESQHMNSKRRRVVDALLANVPKDRFVLFRYPMIKTEYFGDEIPLSADEAFTGTDRARMGCHNDAFLNEWGNDGTYASDDKSDDPAVRAYIAKETLYVPNGGETNVESSSLAKKVYTQAPEEMSIYHWSFCGSSYATAVTNRWRESGIFDTLNVHMGYRYNLIRGEYSDQAAPDGKMNVMIHLRNAGYAPLYNQRTVYLVLKGTKTYSLPLKADPRRWLPNYYDSYVYEQVALPAEIEEGTYQLYLYLPDQYASIAADPRYAIRIANEDVWDENTGYNDLKASVVVSKGAPKDPGELPDVPEGFANVSEPGAQPQKIIENGIFYIVSPSGQRFTILGRPTK